MFPLPLHTARENPPRPSKISTTMNTTQIHPVKTTKPDRDGFTLIELLVTITVIAMLAGLTLAAVSGINQKANRDKAKAEIAAICNALEQFKSVNDTYPAAGGNGTVPFATTGNATIQPFFVANKISTNSSGQLLDPYGNAYLYTQNGTKNPASFDVFSKGKDGVSNTSDDIGNW